MKWRVLIVDDSRTARLALRHLIESDHRFEVVGEASSARTAIEHAGRLSPDLLTMDVYLSPGEDDGVEATRRIMRDCPVPIVVVTAADVGDQELVYRAVGAGALEVLPKPPPIASPAYPAARERFLRICGSLAGVPVVTHRGLPPPPAGGAKAAGSPGPTQPGIVALGASTGGPQLIQGLLARLPAPFPLPLVVVQHISQGFGVGFAAWLQDTTPHPVSYCDEDRALEPGRIFVAPDDAHLIVRAGVAGPVRGAPRGHQPSSIDETFESLARVAGPSTVALLLTGMGRDGVEGLAAIRAAGGRTYVQAPETCVVPAMPEGALAAGAALEALEPEALGALLRKIGGRELGITRPMEDTAGVGN